MRFTIASAKTRAPPRLRLLPLVLLLSLVAVRAHGFPPLRENLKLTDPLSGRTVTLIRQVGEGSFGYVWEVEQSGRRYAMKFYKSFAEGENASARLRNLHAANEENPSEHILRFESILLKSPESPDTVYAVRSELADKNVERLAPDEFRIQDGMTPAEVSRRIRNTAHMFDDVTRGLQELHSLGFAHHDPNPRNILRVGRSYKLGDLDGATPSGVDPPIDAWEMSYSALEYAPGRTVGTDAAAADYCSAANMVLFALFGETPIEVYARRYRFFSLLTAREDLQKNRARRNLYENIVQEMIQKLPRTGVPPEDLRVIEGLKSSLSAALTIDPIRRSEHLMATVPHYGETLMKGQTAARRRAQCTVTPLTEELRRGPH
jgi:serine/threonine protein kinase